MLSLSTERIPIRGSVVSLVRGLGLSLSMVLLLHTRTGSVDVVYVELSRQSRCEVGAKPGSRVEIGYQLSLRNLDSQFESGRGHESSLWRFKSSHGFYGSGTGSPVVFHKHDLVSSTLT